MVGLVGLSLFALYQKPVYAANPTTINFQGKVVRNDTGNEGMNVANNNYSITFRLYNNSGTNPNSTTCALDGTCLWEETQASVTVTNGVFQVELGTSCSFFVSNACNKSAPINFNSSSALYLTMKFNSDAQGYMTPMMHFQSVPYAFNADNLNGLASSAFGQLTAANIFQPTTNVTGMVVKQSSAASPTANIFNVQTANGTNILQATGPSANNSVVTLQSVGAGNALTLTSAAATTWSTSAGLLTLQGASGITLTATGANALTLDSGASGTISIGGTNATTTIGRSGAALTLNGNNFSVSSAGLIVSQTSSYTSDQLLINDGQITAHPAYPNSYTPALSVVTSETTGSRPLFFGYNNAGVWDGFLTTGACGSFTQMCLDLGSGSTAYTALQSSGTTLSVGGGVDGNFSTIAVGNGGATTAQTITIGSNSNTSTTIQAQAGQTALNLANTGATLQTLTNSTTAFQIQNAAGSSIMRISTVDSNPITDPGFETTPLGSLWTAGNVTAPTRVTTDAWGGVASGNLNNSTANTNEGFKNTLSSTLSNNTYTISWYDKLISGTALTDVIAQYAPDGSTFTSCTNINTQTVIVGAWTRHICQFTATSATASNAIRIIQQAAATRSWDIDGVQIDTGSQVTPYGAGSLSFNSNIISPMNFTNTQDSASAFQITDAGNNNVLNVDTSNTNINNMVTNPSFEPGTTGWAAKVGGGGSPSIKQVSAGTVTPYEGLNSMEITTTANANDGAYYSVALSTTTTYTINLYARLASGNPVATVNIGRQDQSGTNVDSCTGLSINNSGWTRLSCTFTTGGTVSSPNIYISQSDATVRKIYVDGVTLETDTNATASYRNGAISLAGSIINSQFILQNSSNSSNAFQVQNAAGVQIFNVSTDQTNDLVLNPGFEVNTAGWSLRGSATNMLRDTGVSYAGVASGKVTVTTAAGGADGIKYSLPTNPTTLMTNTAGYTLSFYAKINGAGTIATIAAGHADDGSTLSACSTITPAATALVSTGWTRFTCAIFTAGAQSGTPYIYLGFTATSGTVTVNIDGVQLELGASATAYGAGSVMFNGVVTSPVIFKNPSNSVTAFQVQNAAGTTLFQIDTLNNLVYVGNPTADGTGQVLVLDTKNTFTAGNYDPTGVEGGMYYNSSIKEFRCYRDNNWENCGINPIDRGYVFEDDFMSGGTTTGIVGTLGWSFSTITTADTMTYNQATPAVSADHPGVLRMATPATANYGSVLMLSGNTNTTASTALSPNQVVKATVAIGSVTNPTQVMRVGISTQSTAVARVTNSGVWWEFDPTVSTTRWSYCYATGAAATCAQDTNVSAAANTFVRLEIRIISTTAVDFFINGYKDSVSSITLGTGSLVIPNIACTSETTAAQYCYVDYYQFRGIAPSGTR
jgi:hypothetical protein